MASDILSVRLSQEARRILEESAATHDAAGASALARDILERWATETRDAKIRASAERVAEHLRQQPDWGDDPAAFFTGVEERRSRGK
jgi:hypothetical protein